jgi:hypothetical protein
MQLKQKANLSQSCDLVSASTVRTIIFITLLFSKNLLLINPAHNYGQKTAADVTAHPAQKNLITIMGCCLHTCRWIQTLQTQMKEDYIKIAKFL